MNMTPKSQATKDKIDKLNLFQIKNFYVSTDNIKKQPTEWEKKTLLSRRKIFINHTSDKRSILVYKETLKLNNKIQYNQI